MRCLELHFFGDKNPELVETSFFHPLSGSELRTVRGKSSGAYLGYGTFQWTKAVRSFCLLSLRTLLIHYRRAEASCPNHAIFRGGPGSLAASLDYALEKQTNWLFDMLGCDESGTSIARRLVLRTNPARNRRGYVAVSINTNFLPADCISIKWNMKQVTKHEELSQLFERIYQIDFCDSYPEPVTLVDIVA